MVREVATVIAILSCRQLVVTIFVGLQRSTCNALAFALAGERIRQLMRIERPRHRASDGSGE